VPSRVVRARLDEASEQGLATLIREGRNESEAVRIALVEAGQRRLRAAGLAAEVRRLVADEGDSAERAAVMADMESISADWPE
jgi:Arc/MetJ-type ribon-helix-helix transcriptional regulator